MLGELYRLLGVIICNESDLICQEIDDELCRTLCSKAFRTRSNLSLTYNLLEMYSELLGLPELGQADCYNHSQLLAFICHDIGRVFEADY